MFRYPLVTLAVAAFSLPLSAAPVQAAPMSAPATQWSAAIAPTGCTTSTEWVTEGSNYYYGRGKVQCTTGRYKVKIQCRNKQTGVGYVVYGSSAVNAPGTATTTCNTGNVAEKVYPVADPLPTGGATTGCAPWMEWVHEGSNHYYGRGRVQCDTGRYKVKINCRNLQTGATYVVYGTQVVTAPGTATRTCYSGNVAESVEALPQ